MIVRRNETWKRYKINVLFGKLILKPLDSRENINGYASCLKKLILSLARNDSLVKRVGRGADQGFISKF